MALAAELEDLVKTLPAEEQGPYRAMLEKHASLRDSHLRQAEFSRKVAEVQRAKADYERQAKESKDWYDENKPRHEAVVAEKATLEEENRKLREAAESAATAAAAGISDATGQHVDVNALREGILADLRTKSGYVTQADVDKIAESKANAIASAQVNGAVTDFLTKTFPQTTNVVLDITELMYDHNAEFGEKLDRAGLSTYMTEHKIVDPKKAYGEMVAAKREERRVEAEVQKRVKQLESQRTIPGTSTPSPEGPGPLQVRLADDKTRDPLAGQDVRIGDNQGAYAAAAALRTEGRV